MNSKEQPLSVKGNVFDLRVIREMVQLMRPYAWHFLGVMALMLLLAVLMPLTPLLIQHALDRYLPLGDAQGIWQMVVLLFALLIVQAMAKYMYLYAAGLLGQRVIRDLRMHLYAHVQRLRLRFFDKTPIGRLVTRCVSDIETLLNVFSEGLASILGDLCLLIAILGIMFALDWRLTLISLSTLPLLLLSTYVFKERIKVAFNAVRTAVSNLNAFVQEHITGMALVQIFGAQSRVQRQFEALNLSHRKSHMRSVLYYSVYFPIAEIILATSIGLLVWYGTGQIVKGTLTLGELIAFIMYVQMFFRPIRMIADRFNTLQLGIVSARRVFLLLAQKDFMPDTGKHTAEGIRGDLAFKHVFLSYEPGEYVLRDLSFQVRAGEKVALVGETGSGKTSTIHLLNRLYDPVQGCILLDGRDITAYQLSSLRRQVGFVLQDVFLFSDSLRNNITLMDESISDLAVQELATELGCWKHLEALGGLDHVVSERGASLSGGERQLVSFLRAMIHDPRLLVLDEATSSVDNQTEQVLQKAMKTLMEGRTTLVVAHRLSTIQDADKILVLADGELIESGTHLDLLEQQGAYAKLYQSQFALHQADP